MDMLEMEALAKVLLMMCQPRWWLKDAPVVWIASQLIGGLADRPTGWLTDLLTDQLVDWLDTDGWPVRWLMHWLADLLLDAWQADCCLYTTELLTKDELFLICR